MFDKIDKFMGDLFVPPIIWFCQVTGWSQHRVHNMGWLLATFVLVTEITVTMKPADHYSVKMGSGSWMIAIILVLAASRIYGFVRDPDRVSHPSLFMRMLLFFGMIVFEGGMGVVHTFLHVPHPFFLKGILWDVLTLAAEYASTIPRIPPRRRREAASRMKSSVA